MPYREKCRTLYQSKCACNNGFVQYYSITATNDWGNTTTNKTPVEIICDHCKDKYHYEQSDYLDDYLVPNGSSFPKSEPHLNKNSYYNNNEKLVKDKTKSDIKAMIVDMQKYRYIKDLKNQDAIEFAEYWWWENKRKSLKPMILHLQEVYNNYDTIKASSEQKTLAFQKHNKKQEDYIKKLNSTIKESYKLDFSSTPNNNANGNKDAKSNYENYNNSSQQIICHPSLKTDLVNHYWDSYFIKECINPKCTLLRKVSFNKPQFLITKKYLCICQICGHEEEVLSSDFMISFDDEQGYYIEPCCSCHTVSSFEAKTMDILNKLDVTFIREKSFDDLLGETETLRFDFALFKSVDEKGIPIIDLIIELQGPHHYKVGYYDEFNNYITDDTDYNNSINTKEKFERQIRYDQKKKDYCSQHDINIEYIKYTASNDHERLEKKLIEILKKHGYRYYLGI